MFIRPCKSKYSGSLYVSPGRLAQAPALRAAKGYFKMNGNSPTPGRGKYLFLRPPSHNISIFRYSEMKARGRFFSQRKYFQRFVKIWKCPVSPVLTPLNISRPSDRLGILRQTWREGDEILGQRVFVSSSPPESKMCSPREMLMRVRLLLHRFHQRKILIYSVVIPTWIWPLSTLLSTLM